jgi:hypothetical protein
MQEALHDHPELVALRKLEQAVRACGLPYIMVSGPSHFERLAAVLNEVAKARETTGQAA